MGSSKKITVSYWYKLIAHLGWCKGPIDALLEIRGGDRTAWKGQMESSGFINVNRPNLYGGESAEGGIDGTFEVMMGDADQVPNSYLASEFGDAQPGYRGRATVLLRGPKVGAGNPYPKPLYFKLRRIFKGWDDDVCWYPERAEVGTLWTGPQAIYVAVDFSGSMNEMTPNGQTRYQNAAAALAEFFDLVDDIRQRSDVRVDLMGVGWSDSSTTILRRSANTAGVAAVKNFFTSRSTVNGPQTDFVYATGPAAAFFDGAPANARRTFIFITDGEPSRTGYPFPLTEAQAQEFCGEAATQLFAINGVRAYGFNIDLPDTTWTSYLDNTSDDNVPVISGDDPSALTNSLYDSITGVISMNAAHILYDSITSRRENGGMEEPIGRINEASFRAAADKLWAEGFGLCCTWHGGESAEQFQQRICNVIGGSLTQSRKDGQYYLDLLRSVSDPSSLPTLTDDDITDWEVEPALPSESINQIQVKWFDPETREERITTPIQALGAIEDAGGILADIREYYEIPYEGLALRVAQRDLNSSSSALWKFTITCTRKPYDLRPGMQVRLLCPKRGFADVIVVIGDIDYGTLSDEEIHIVALQDVFAMPTSAFVDVQDGLAPPSSASPALITDQVLIESPYVELAAAMNTADLNALDDAAGFILAGAGRPANGHNYQLSTRAVGEAYEDSVLGDWTPTARVVEADERVAGAPPETEFTLTAMKMLDQVAVGTWAKWGTEIVRVDALNVTTGAVTFGRGCADTLPQEHAANERVWFLADWNSTDSREYADGETVNAKLMNRTGAAQVPPAYATELSVVMAARLARPYPPSNVKINGAYYPETVFGDITMSWAHRNRVAQADQLIDFEQSSVTPEDGQTYTMRAYLGGGTVPTYEQTGISGDSHTWVGPTDGDYRFELFSERDGLESWQVFEHELSIGGALWTPANLATPSKLWFNDTSAVTEVSGALSQVNDLSGNDYHATQSSSSARPTRVPAVLNGRPVFRFDGGDRLVGPSSGDAIKMLSGIAEAWAIIVYKSSSTSRGNMYLMGITHTGGNLARFLAVNSSTTGGTYTNRPGVGGRSNTSDGYSEMRSATAVGVNWTMALHRINYPTKTGIVHVNGSAAESATLANMTAANSQAVDQAPFVFGGDNLNHFTGDIGEAVFGVGVLPPEEIDRLFGYLAWKWGLVSSLPSGHPYKLSPPIV